MSKSFKKFKKALQNYRYVKSYYWGFKEVFGYALNKLNITLDEIQVEGNTPWNQRTTRKSRRSQPYYHPQKMYFEKLCRILIGDPGFMPTLTPQNISLIKEFIDYTLKHLSASNKTCTTFAMFLGFFSRNIKEFKNMKAKVLPKTPRTMKKVSAFKYQWDKMGKENEKYLEILAEEAGYGLNFVNE